MDRGGQRVSEAAGAGRCGLLLLACLALPAGALVLESAPDAPPPPASGFEHVGARGSLSGIYLGAGWVLTAAHVGAGDLTLGGVRYPAVADSQVRLRAGDGADSPPDLLLYRIDPHPDLPPLRIGRATPPAGAEVLLFGCGVGRGERLQFRGLPGWDWSGEKACRWGTNEVAHLRVFDAQKGSRTRAFATEFTPGTSDREAQAAHADSGGAVVCRAGGRWELCGVMLAVGLFEGQPGSSTFPGNFTYAADLAHYRDQILSIAALPEADP